MKPDRNKPCPCGSQKKYKKCCGNPAIQPAAPVHHDYRHYRAYVKGESYSPYRMQADEPERYIGYCTEHDPVGPTEFVADGIACMVTNITKVNQADATKIARRSLPLGSWVVTHREPGQTELHLDGPWSSMQEACDFGRHTYGVVRYKAMPALK